MSPEQLIADALPMLARISRMILVSSEEKRLARGLYAALSGPKGVEIASAVAPYIPVLSAPAGAVTTQGQVDWTAVTPGEGAVIVFAGASGFEVGAGVKLSIDGASKTVAELASWLTENSCSVSAEVSGEGQASSADFIRSEG